MFAKYKKQINFKKVDFYANGLDCWIKACSIKELKGFYLTYYTTVKSLASTRLLE